uniref:Uncharacterized protein n=1 Tax=Octopus bimaculoides TaxID=37653 RepID=A0A0L8I5C8_OCTBM
MNIIFCKRSSVVNKGWSSYRSASCYFVIYWVFIVVVTKRVIFEELISNLIHILN